MTIATVISALTVLPGCTPNPARPTASTVTAGPARELSPAEQGRVDQAEQRLIQRCMADKGFRYWVFPRVDADTFRAFTYRFVQDDVEWSREHGYGERLRQAFFEAKKRDRNLSYQKGLSPTERDRYTTALQGGRDTPMLSAPLPSGGTVRSPGGGCTHSARNELYGDAEAFFRADKVATDLTGVYVPKVMRDPRFTGAMKAWSRCMRDLTGGSYADSDAARADVRKRAAGFGASQARAIEADIAVADATCARRTSLRGIFSRLDREYGDPVRERYADEIATRNRMKLAALRRADHIGAPD
ncbi:hypothetical protein [Streptomyces dioscori]|uniref:hypothetical protein n=1 Tax=Streptomyces dioscori TaxID=2109333 RepID=UPI00131B3AE1|nr:hypothetical protein [Streptomyces dioscori]